MPLAVACDLAAGALLAALLVWNGQFEGPLLWFATLALIGGVRFLRMRSTTRAAVMARDPAPARIALVVGVAGSGLAWGLGALLLTPIGDVATLVVICFFAAGMTAGASASLNAAPYIFLAFAIPFLGSLVARLALEMTMASGAMAVAVAIYGAALYMIARGGRSAVEQALRLWLANRRLTRNLLVARANEFAALRRATDQSIARRQAEDAAAAKSRFLATVSHELRTPLNAVIGFSDMIADEFYGPIGNAKYHEYAHEIRGSGERLLRLIDDILAISVAERPDRPARFGSVEFRPLAESVAKEFALVDGDHAERISVSVAPDLVVHADRLLLRRILQNLIENALKFSPPEGAIVLAAERRAGGDAVIRVVDEGAGIPEDKISRMLEPFTQIDDSDGRRHAGVGLGLALVKQHVDQLGGNLDISNGQHGGLVVEITLPQAPSAAVAASAGDC